MPKPIVFQTIHVESITQANKLAERLCRKGYYFVCEISVPMPGRWFTFSNTIDFEHNASLFKDIVYARMGVPQP